MALAEHQSAAVTAATRDDALETALPPFVGDSGGGGDGGVVPNWDDEKQGAKCCGCCCDMRRAVIIISIIFLVGDVLRLVSMIGGLSASKSLDLEDDEEVHESWKQEQRFGAIIYSIGAVGALCSLVGALRYNIPLVSVNVISLIIIFIIHIVIQVRAIDDINQNDKDEDPRLPVLWIVLDTILRGLYIYPHVGFMMEVKKGIMSKDNYPREEYSCCCTKIW